MALALRTRPGKQRTNGKATDEEDKLKGYTFHGLNFTVKNGQGQSECPFCGGEKFFVARKTGMYDCKSCGVKGNLYTFLAEFHKLMLAEPETAKAPAVLSKARGIPVGAFESYEIAYDGSRFYFPRFCFEGKLVGLDVWDGPGKMPDGSSRPVFPTATTKTHLLGAHNLAASPTDEPIYLAEGHWDYFALEWLRSRVGEPACVLGKPGTGTFKDDWVEKFRGRDVILCDDNDVGAQGGLNKKGQKIEGGQPRTIRLLSPVVKSLQRLVWPEGTPTGYDLNDFISKRCKSPKACWNEFSSLLQKIPGAGTNTDTAEVVSDELDSQQLAAKLAKRQAPGKPPELAKVLKTFRGLFHLNKNMEDAITIALAVVISIRLPGDPLWIFLVGPPGCMSGETIVEVNRAGKSYKTRLDDLVHSFNGGFTRGHAWSPEIPTTIRARMDDGTIGLAPLVAAVSSGEKTVYRVTTSSGRSVKATAKHPFLTATGWKPLRKLAVGQHVYLDAGVKASGERKKKTSYLQVQGLKHHPYARKRTQNIFCVCKHRLVVEAFSNSVTLDVYIERLRTGRDLQGFQFLDPSKIVHHKDENPKNNKLDNLEVLDSHSEHARKHCLAGKWRNVVARVDLETITAIEKIGIEETYDLTVAGAQNFLANGFVVHNTGKTLFLESLENSPERVIHRSRIRPHDLVSGYITQDGSDPSLLPRISQRCFVVKDFTTIKSLSAQEQEGVAGVLRDAYDGRVHVPFANITGGRNYPSCHFAFIAAVTDVIHIDNRSSMGERFVKVEFLGDDNDTEKHILAALDNADKATEFIEDKQKLQALVSDFIDRDIDAGKAPTASATLKTQLAALTRVVAILRSSVERGQHGDLHFRTRSEVGTRLAGQLLKLGKSIAIIRGKHTVDAECYRLMEKVAFDTAYGWNLDIVRVLVKHSDRKLKINELAKYVHISTSALGRKLENLLEIRAVVRDTVEPDKTTKSYAKAGNPASVYSVDPKLLALWKKAKLPI